MIDSVLIRTELLRIYIPSARQKLVFSALERHNNYDYKTDEQYMRKARLLTAALVNQGKSHPWVARYVAQWELEDQREG